MDDVPKRSPLKNLWQLPEFRGHYFARPRRHQFGRTSMMLFLTDLSIDWYMKRLPGADPNRPIGIGDISLENGSAPPTHHTHVHGSCVDIYILSRSGARRSDTENKITFESDDYDRAATKALAAGIVRILERGYQCVQFLYDDPEVHKVWPGRIVRKQERPHADHFHIQLNDPTPYAGREDEVLAMSLGERALGF